MPQKQHKPEEIVAKLRQVDVLVSQGRSVAEAVRSIGVTQFTYYRWRKEFGGLKANQLKRLKELEKENERLRKAVSDPTLEKLILREAAGRTPQRRDLLQPRRGEDRHRELAPSLQHEAPALVAGGPPTGSRGRAGAGSAIRDTSPATPTVAPRPIMH
ncbi:transposase [Rhodovulum imhoffii]|uniref:Transposase n=1 Tax=Rhodovulum imhoffii TaxID=365340 RepID=A0A2T5BUD5_9RHOB|nr:transposase [Rhodovulum imhoffii]